MMRAALLSPLCLQCTLAIDVKWTAAGEVSRFSKKYRDALGVDDSKWTQGEWEAWARGAVATIDAAAMWLGVPTSVVWAFVLLATLLVIGQGGLRRFVSARKRNRVARALLLAEAAEAQQRTQAAAELQAQMRRAKVPTANGTENRNSVRTCRFCDLPVVDDTFVEAHVRGKRHVKLAALAGAVAAEAIADCWVWREAVSTRAAESAPEESPPEPPKQFAAPSKGGRWEKAGGAAGKGEVRRRAKGK